MITIVTSPVGGTGVSVSSVLLALWMREVAPCVRLIDLSARRGDSPSTAFTATPGLDVIQASKDASTDEQDSSQRAFTAAWHRAQCAMDFISSDIACVVDLPQAFATWAWADIVRWVRHERALELVVLVAPSPAAVRCLERLPTEIAGSLILAYPEWMPGSRRMIGDSPDRLRLREAGAREMSLPSLAWGSASDSLNKGEVPIGKNAPASLLGRLQLRHGLGRLALGFSAAWPASRSDAASCYSLQWSQQNKRQPET